MRRPSLLLTTLIALSLIASLVILYVTSYKNFFTDEWSFIDSRRPWNTTVILIPHNGHWSTIPVLVWKVLFTAFGLRSHIPYEAAVLVMHVAAVLLLFALVRRRSGDLPAVAVALTLLVLGSGAEDIVWAFQVGFTGSVAFGLLAMLLLDGDPPFPSRLVTASAALVASMMCSGVGLVFVIAIGTELAFDARRRRFLLALIAPAAAYVEWFLAFGIGPGGVSDSLLHGPIGLTYIAMLTDFVLTGIAASAAGVFGLTIVSAAVLPVLVVLILWHWIHRRTIESWQVGMVVGLLSWFVLTGLGRVQYGPSYATQSRYLYVGAIFLLPLIADAATDLPWQGLWRPALIAAFICCLGANTSQLLGAATSQTALMRTENAELQTIEVFRGAPDMSLYTPLDLNTMPSLVEPAKYFAEIDQFGSPVAPATVDSLRRLPPEAVNTAMRNAFGAAFTATEDPNRSTRGMQCMSADSTLVSGIEFQVPAGASVMLQSSNASPASFFLWFQGASPPEPILRALLPPAIPTWLHVPDTGKAIRWRLRVMLDNHSLLQVCGPDAIGYNQPLIPRYRGEASLGAFSPRWSVTTDPLAYGGHVAKASGTSDSFQNDVFGAPTIPVPGIYDLWFRIRVASTTKAHAEMKVGLWIDEQSTWLAATMYSPEQISTSFTWLRVAVGVSTPTGQSIQFLASFIGTLSTDWYIDEAVLTSTGFGPTGPRD